MFKLFESYSARDGGDVFSGRRNRLTGKTTFSVFRNGRRRDSWSVKESRSKFLSNFFKNGKRF